MASVSTGERRQFAILGMAVAGTWGALVVAGAGSGFFAALYPPLIAVIVAATIAGPTLVYFGSTRLQAYAASVGHRPIVLFHTWRVPAALAFFWYGLNGQLPTAFWVLAGIGDLVAGCYAAFLLVRPESARRYLSFHIFGFADFVIAVGAGLTFTLLLDPRMAVITTLPMALIPLWGVGISGTTHLIAFDLLRKGAGLDASRLQHGAVAA